MASMVMLLLVALATMTTSTKLADRSERRTPHLEVGLRRRTNKRIISLAKIETCGNFPPETPEDRKGMLVQFHGKGDDYCAYMEPLKKRLKEEEGIEITSYEVWDDSRHLELLQKVDNGRCNGVPFFYNKNTKQWICGATSYENLYKWATDQRCDQFAPPQDLLQPKVEVVDEPPPENAVQGLIATIKAKGRQVIATRDMVEDMKK